MSRAASTSTVTLRAAAFGYEGRRVVSDVDLDLGPGSFLGIVGPNGSGKSTLFRGILGLLAPLSGRVERNDTRFGYVPQSHVLDAIFPLTVEELVLMGAERRLTRLGGLRRQTRQQCGELLERVGLFAVRRSPFSDLSGGQRQRALVARALLTQPTMMLLDEPTSGVDRDAAADIAQILREVHAGGVGILLVSHDLELVRKIASEVLVVANGKVHPAGVESFADPAWLRSVFAAPGGAAAKGAI